MTTTLHIPEVGALPRVNEVLAQWQADGAPVQLHPGDLGWYALRGELATAAALRVWTDGDEIVSIALLDGPQLARFAVAPDSVHDAAVARRIAADLDDPAAGVLTPGEATVEARGAEALGAELRSRGWREGDRWTPLRLELRPAIDVDMSRVHAVAPHETANWVRVHWSAFRGTALPPDRLANFVDGWTTAAQSALRNDVRILRLDDESGAAVAVAAVWTAGDGRPGLIEPMAVHADHRGRRYGVHMTRAAARALQDAGSSSAIVCADHTNAAAVAAYTSAGFAAETEVPDWVRTG